MALTDSGNVCRVRFKKTTFSVVTSKEWTPYAYRVSVGFVGRGVMSGNDHDKTDPRNGFWSSNALRYPVGLSGISVFDRRPDVTVVYRNKSEILLFHPSTGSVSYRRRTRNRIPGLLEIKHENGHDYFPLDSQNISRWSAKNAETPWIPVSML